LRRPGNVWDRLPPVVRHVRSWVPAFWAYVCTFTLLFVFLNVVVYPPHIPAELHLRMFHVTMVGIAALVALWAFLRARAKTELKRRGLGAADAHRVLMSVPPSRVSFWARPHIAAVLAPAPRPEPSRRSDSPHDQLQSILRLADDLSGPVRPLGAEAAVAARQLIASIEHADQEIAALARNLEPGEEERLADKIEALAPAPGRSDDHAPMRALLEKQLELMRGLSRRIDEARETRSRRVEMLKSLALHLASLRARSVQTPTEVHSLSDRVRALCEDIGRQALAPEGQSAEAGRSLDQMATLDRTRNDRKTHP
jgi:hypothetical protein